MIAFGLFEPDNVPLNYVSKKDTDFQISINWCRENNRLKQIFCIYN